MNFLNKLKNKFFNNKDDEIDKYNKIFSKSNENLKKNLPDFMIDSSKYDDEYFDKLEELFILSDLGMETSLEIVNNLRKKIKKLKHKNSEHVNELIINFLKKRYLDNIRDKNYELNYSNSIIPTVYLFVGVNGVGKTTIIGKLANKFKNEGKKVLLVAGDTFRAAAVEQLKNWADRINVDIFTGKSDSSGVIYSGVEKAINENYDIVLCDTSGRLQNKVNLMKELNKLERVIKKLIPNAPHETFLVIDASTGQNGVSQAKIFSNTLNISSIIITKMDGTAKGGIAFVIAENMKIPIKIISTGECLGDISEFSIDKYLFGLLNNFYN